MAKYVTLRDVQHRFSEAGITLRLDDVPADRLAEVFEQVAGDVEDLIDQYCQHFYLDEDLVNSPWVRRRASWLFCYFLSMRRGNAAIFQARYNEIVDELERVGNGTLLIPGLPRRADMTPALSNVVVDERFYISKVRVQPSISTGGTSGRQALSPVIPYEWL